MTGGELAWDHHHRKSRTRHFGVLVVQSKAPEPWTEEAGARFVQRVLQLLVKVSENQSTCIAFSYLRLEGLDEPEHADKSIDQLIKRMKNKK